MRHSNYRRPKQPKDIFTFFMLVFFFVVVARLLYCLFEMAQIGAFDLIF